MSKPLKFMHIPKNAGTSIEFAAQKVKIRWGIFDKDFNIQWKIPGCHNHQPLYYASNPRIYNRLITRFDYFCVVRDPYERAISNFYCIRHSLSKLNTGFIEAMRNGIPSDKWAREGSVEEFNQGIRTGIALNQRNDHWAPQSLFVYYHEGDVQKHQIIKHILRYENLDVEFSDLMKKYKLPIILNVKLNPGCKKYTVDDLDSETIKAINEFYRMDFLNFNYPMRSVPEIVEDTTSRNDSTTKSINDLAVIIPELKISTTDKNSSNIEPQE